MYSSFISTSLVNQSTVDKDILFCELHGRYAYNAMELFPTDYWY